jgi:hypothetical protein
MDCNNEGCLTAGERDELEVLVELSQTLSLLRAEAWQILGPLKLRSAAVRCIRGI